MVLNRPVELAAVTGKMGTRIKMSGKATYQEFALVVIYQRLEAEYPIPGWEFSSC
jgi:hypothetical protein